MTTAVHGIIEGANGVRALWILFSHRKEIKLWFLAWEETGDLWSNPHAKKATSPVP